MFFNFLHGFSSAQLCVKTIIIFLLFAVTSNAANDSVFVSIPEQNIKGRIYTTPGAIFFSPQELDFGKLEVGYDYLNTNDLFIVQDGKGNEQFYALAEGSKQKKNTVFYGKIQYRNFTKKDVQWSHAYDYFRIAPYATADSIGGDVKGEEYQLTGGFATKYNRWIFGLDGGYSAGNSYRKTDPRPMATATDLFLQIGASYSLNNQYQAGFSLRAGNYHEKINVKTVQERTNYAFFSLKGFGLYNLRLSENASNYSWLYEGKNIGASVFFIPQNKNGWTGNFAFNYETIDSNLGNNLTPYTLDTYTFKTDIGWQQSSATKKWLVFLNYDYSLSKGTERIYESRKVNDVFEQYFLLFANQFYSKSSSIVKLNLCREWISEKSLRWIRAEVGYMNNEARYAYPKYQMTFNRLLADVALGGEFKINASSLIPEISLSYSPLLSSSKNLPQNNRIFDLSVLPSIPYLEAELFKIDAGLTYMKSLKNQTRLYLSVKAFYMFDKDRNREGVSAALGIRY